mmetsp:Transcript_14299/g.21543  ORF Transcript_14299/g.21543 Transcript_14299/m.21543 type:complete len:448 (-) Transcript_14299:658-2001(-)
MSTHQTIVVELGCSRIKVGFAGEPKPRRVLSSGDGGALGIDDGMCTSSCTWNHFYSYLSSSSDAVIGSDNAHSKVTSSYDWEKTLYPLFSYILTSILFIQRPSRHRILVLMNDIFPPRHLREALLRVLLDYLNLGSVLLVNGGGFGSVQYLLEGMNLSSNPLMTQQPKASLVVDIGTNEARVAVLVPGASFLVETYQAIPAGYQAFLRKVLALYQEANEDWATNATVEDVNVIVQAWMSAPNTDISTAATTISVELPTLMKQSNDLSEASAVSSTIQVSVQPLLEAFHQVYLDYTQPTSLVYAILNSVLASPIDFRKVALQNIILLGGGSVALRSFGKGLKVEVETAIKVACGVSLGDDTQAMEEEKKDDGMEVSSIAQGRFQSLKAAVERSGGQEGGVQVKYPDPFAADVAHWIGASVMGKLRLSNEDWISVDSSVVSARGERLRR